MSTYNLNDNVNESFSFTLGGFEYQMRYPTVEETENFQKILAKSDEEKNTDAVMAEMYSYISSDDEKAPPIAEAMKKQNIRVIKNFNEMIKAEFGAE